MTATLEFDLPERLCVTEANAFVPFLRDHPDAPLTVNVGRLRRLDTLLVQTLLAVATDRRARGVPFCVTGLTSDRVDQLHALGITEDMLCLQVTE